MNDLSEPIGYGAMVFMKAVEMRVRSSKKIEATSFRAGNFHAYQLFSFLPKELSRVNMIAIVLYSLHAVTNQEEC